MSKVLVLGDLVPREGDLGAMLQGAGTELVQALEPAWAQVDLTIANLECPLFDGHNPTPKDGPVLSAPTAVGASLKRMGLDAVGLANNHLMDHGRPGMESTRAVLEAAGLRHGGAGGDLDEASRPMEFDLGGTLISILCVSHNEFGTAAPARPGVFGFDHARLFRAMHQVPPGSRLVVLLHAGAEHHPYPSPRLRDTCRLLAEWGAAAVICQHSHTVGAWEYWGNAVIVYGQGNFLFKRLASDSASEEWDVGMAVELCFDESGVAPVAFHFFKQGAVGLEPKDPGWETDQKIALQERSRLLSVPGALEQVWKEFALSQSLHYRHAVSGSRSLVRRILGRIGMLDMLTSARGRRERLNVIRCETHREALLTILEDAERSETGRW